MLQGSIWGPLIFIIYMNYIHDVSSKSHVILFADDTDLTSTFDVNIDNNDNRLRNIENLIPHLDCNKQMIDRVTYSNCLTIDQYLTLNVHVKHIKQDIKSLGIMRKSKRFYAPPPPPPPKKKKKKKKTKTKKKKQSLESYITAFCPIYDIAYCHGVLKQINYSNYNESFSNYYMQ